ncbi:DUF3592 domain-containing protein [Nocardioides sp.]|uniref:DUF3592 domain-containing protein n=1 Tax=Nocardioides sp. TaxID=35761 RepID=UPI002BFDE81A|nr:DUF3592 domain-containing protein [Nocardioides sp.]HXH79990.1 DUF3592 domain-containing protein [Nocardioides sp.]
MPDELADVGWGWVTVAAGVFLVAIMLKYLMMIWRRRRTWVVTEATVGKVRTRSSSSGEGGTYVNYHYTDSSGERHMGVDSPWFRAPKRKSKLQVRYDPEHPGMSEALMPLWGELAIVALISASGVALTLMSLAGWMDA